VSQCKPRRSRSGSSANLIILYTPPVAFRNMSKAAFSMLVWAFYLTAVGALLLFAPSLSCWIFGLRDPIGVWPRVSGMLFWVIAYYCFYAALTDERRFIAWTNHTRPLMIWFVAIFVAMDLEDPMLYLFGFIDLAGAAWTAVALRRDKRAAGPPLARPDACAGAYGRGGTVARRGTRCGGTAWSTLVDPGAAGARQLGTPCPRR
jgi:hypothetical protein